MAELSQAAYQDLRTYIVANWSYVAFADGGGSQILRLPLSDPRVTWTHVPNSPQNHNQTLELTIVLKGSDADIGGVNGATLPKTVASSRIHKTSGDSTPMATEAFNAFVFATTDDELTVKHRIQMPQL